MLYKFFKRLLGHLVYFTVFGTIFTGSLFITYGYRYDFQENTIIETGVIDLCFEPNDAELWIDGVKQNDTACTTLRGIAVGPHKIEVKKIGYYPWQKTLWVNNSRVNIFKGIVLIPQSQFYPSQTWAKGVTRAWISPDQSQMAVYESGLKVLKIFPVAGQDPLIFEIPEKIVDLAWKNQDQLTIETENNIYGVNLLNKTLGPVLDPASRTAGLSLSLTEWLSKKPSLLQIRNGRELWAGRGKKERLITRYAEPIVFADYFYNESNILIATDTRVMLCDLNGENCYEISGKDPGASVWLLPETKKLMIIESGELKLLDLNTTEDQNKPLNI